MEKAALGICDHQMPRAAFCVAWRTPEYTRDGKTALTRSCIRTALCSAVRGKVLFWMVPRVRMPTTPGYHWTKAMCDTCGTMNSNGGINGYGFGRNVYNLYDCAAEFMEDLDKRVTYE